MVGSPASKDGCADWANRENVAMSSLRFIEALHENSSWQLIGPFFARSFECIKQSFGSERLGCTAWLVASQYKGFFKTCQGENRVYDYKILLDDTGSITQIDWNALGTQWQLRRSSNSS